MSVEKMSRRDFLRGSALVAASVTLAACRPSGPESEDSQAEETAAEGSIAEPGTTDSTEGAAPAPEPVTIVAKAWPGSPFETESITAAIAKFEEESPDIKVDWQTEPQAYAEKVLTQIAAGTPPDTMYASADDFFSWVSQDVLLDITAFVDEDGELGEPEYWTNYDEEIARCTWEGRWYGLGSCWVAPHLYTNLDLLEAAGVEPPSNDPSEAWTWEEFLDAANALTLDSSGKHPGEDGFDPSDIEQHGVQWPTTMLFLGAALGSNGGESTAPAPDGRFLVDSPEAMEAIQAVADLATVHHVAPQGAFFEEIGMNNLEALGSGKLAMIVDGSWSLMRMQPLREQFTLGTAVLPKMKAPYTVILAHNQAMSADGQQKEATWKFVRFLSGDFYQKALCAGGLWLPNHASLGTPEAIASWINPEVHTDGYEKVALDYVVEAGHTMFQAPGFVEASAMISSALDEVWIGNAQVVDVLPDAVAEANAVIEEWATE